MLLHTEGTHGSVTYNRCLYVMTHRTHGFVGISGCLYVMTDRPHSFVRYVPTAVCSCHILSRVWRRNRKGTKLTRTVLLFILRPNASFAVPPSYTLVWALVRVSVGPVAHFCCGFVYPLLWVCIRRIAGFCTHYCGFLFYTPYCGFLCRDSASPIARFLLLYTPYCGFLLRVSIRSVACFYTPFCGILYALLRVSIRPVAGLHGLCYRFLCRLVLRWPCAVEG